MPCTKPRPTVKLPDGESLWSKGSIHPRRFVRSAGRKARRDLRSRPKERSAVRRPNPAVARRNVVNGWHRAISVTTLAVAVALVASAGAPAAGALKWRPATPRQRAPASAETVWQIRDLGTLGGRMSSVRAGNAHGILAGVSTTRSGSRHVVLWRSGHVQDLGPITPNPSDEIVLLNDAGDVAWNAPGGQPVIWRRGRTHRLGSLGGGRAWLRSMNAKSEIVGTSQTAERDAQGRPITHGFLWRRGTMTDLGALLPVSIDDDGAVSGTRSTAADGRPIVWRSGKVSRLPVLAGYDYCDARSVGRGRVLGTCSSAGGRRQSYLWADGRATRLGWFDAYGINVRGRYSARSASPLAAGLGGSAHTPCSGSMGAFRTSALWAALAAIQLPLTRRDASSVRASAEGFAPFSGTETDDALPTLAHSAEAFGFAGSGRVFGYSTTRDHLTHAVVWTEVPGPT